MGGDLELAWYALQPLLVVGSAIGWYLGKKSNAMILAEDVIDSLIEQEYLKTRGHGENMQILKHTEWCDDKDSG